MVEGMTMGWGPQPVTQLEKGPETLSVGQPDQHLLSVSFSGSSGNRCSTQGSTRSICNGAAYVRTECSLSKQGHNTQSTHTRPPLHMLDVAHCLSSPVFPT